MGMKVVVDTKILSALPARTSQVVSAFLSAEAEQTVNDIKMSIQQVSYGRRYGAHIASKPGDPPNIDIGTLYGSYKWRPIGENTRRIETGVEYAPHLEFGTEQGLAAGMLGPKAQRMAPRPHVGPAMERLRERLPKDAVKFRLVRP